MKKFSMPIDSIVFLYLKQESKWLPSGRVVKNDDDEIVLIPQVRIRVQKNARDCEKVEPWRLEDTGEEIWLSTRATADSDREVHVSTENIIAWEKAKVRHADRNEYVNLEDVNVEKMHVYC